MRKLPWIIAFCGILMTGCSGVSFGINFFSLDPMGAVGIVFNLLGIILGLGMVGFAIAGKEGEGPSAGSYLREVRHRTYAPTRPPVRFQCPACGRSYTAAGALVGSNFTCREASCGQEFPVPNSPADSPADAAGGDKMPA